MFNTWREKEFLYSITSAIHEHADKVSDERMFFVGVCGVIASLLIVWSAFFLNNRQLEQQIKISFFRERNELYLFLQKLCYFASQQKINLKKYNIIGHDDKSKKFYMWLKIFPQVLKFTHLLRTQRDFEDEQKMRYTNSRKCISDHEMSNVKKIISGIEYVSDSGLEFDRRFEDYHIELINTIGKITQIIRIFKLTDKNLQALQSITNGLEYSFRDIHDDNISIEQYKEKMIALLSELEILDIFIEMQTQIDFVGVYRKNCKCKHYFKKLCKFKK